MNVQRNQTRTYKSPSEDVRPLDPNVLQRRASNPASHIWVNASAGTGKTKVLTDRVLRLLLPRADGTPGSQPANILCITFTKAGAGEMQLRLQKTLSEWAILPIEASDDEPSLTQELKKLLGEMPTPKQIEVASALFHTVIDAPIGLRIMTIHSFCQSILARFPLEAGIQPQQIPLEESEANAILEQAIQICFRKAEQDRQTDILEAKTAIAQTINYEQFLNICQTILNERYQLKNTLKNTFGIDGFYNKLCSLSGIDAGKTSEHYLLEGIQDTAFDHTGLQACMRALSESSSEKEQTTSQDLANFLSSNQQERLQSFNTYRQIFLKADMSVRAKLLNKTTAQNNPECLNIMEKEAERLLKLTQRMAAAKTCLLNKHLLTLVENILENYEDIKQQRGALDYNDMVLKALKLLQERPNWVLYKLDQNIDHLLIDEAQDTNPEQWDIISILCEEFFTHTTDESIMRTLFVVGDEKQSIYGFQRASPQKFHDLKSKLKQKADESAQSWDSVDMMTSFRSTESVLKSVDATFNAESNKCKLTSKQLSHNSYRLGEAGHVELWPLIEDEETPDFDPWAPPIKIIEKNDSQSKLANKIAKTIKNWLATAEALVSQDRPIQPSDIMILTRTRSALTEKINRALREQNIPLHGADRLNISNSIAVEDLIALCEVCLLLSDDYKLACVLKSPLIDMDEDALFELAQKRTGSLIDELKNKYKNIYDYIINVQKKLLNSRPFESLTYILETSCPASKQSGQAAFTKRLGPDCQDPLQELLNCALRYEQTHIPAPQLFLNWLQQEDIEIKREFDDSTNAVRIMTVHGAKGLQAPIVFLPDTIVTAQSQTSKSDTILWPDKTGLPIPVWCPKSSYSFGLHEKAKKTAKDLDWAEYQRLLYVSMTRAEDRLYICGCTNNKTKPLEQSWYYQMETGLKSCAEIQMQDENLILYNPQTKEVQKKVLQIKTDDIKTNGDKWLNVKAPKEAEISTLRPSETGEPYDSQQKSTQSEPRDIAKLRGTITHRLLETLPSKETINHLQFIETYLENHLPDSHKDLKASIKEEVIRVLEDQSLAFIFSNPALAELPVSGYTSSTQKFSGIIDRLVVEDNTIWIIDYKTNRIDKNNQSALIKHYTKQLNLYKKSIEKIYPNKAVKAAIVWTQTAQLQEVIEA